MWENVNIDSSLCIPCQLLSCDIDRLIKIEFITPVFIHSMRLDTNYVSCSLVRHYPGKHAPTEKYYRVLFFLPRSTEKLIKANRCIYFYTLNF